MRVPRPCSLAARMYPPLCFTRPYTIERPSPVPLPGALRGEERLEGTLQGRRGHPVARVGHHETDVLAGLDLLVLGRERRAGRHVHQRRANRERPAIRHGIAGIEREVEEHLLDLAHVRPDPLAQRPGLKLEGAAVAQRTGEERPQALDHGVQVDDLGLEMLAPAVARGVAP